MIENLAAGASADEVHRTEIILRKIFTPPVIKRLARQGQWPKGHDLSLFAQLIQEAAFWYLQEAGEPNANTRFAETKALLKAARKRDGDGVVKVLKALSQETRWSLQIRCDARRIKLPEQEDFSNPDAVGRACELIASITVIGGRVKKGRKRPGQKQSMAWHDEVFAPIPQRNFSKRSAERNFVRRVRAAWRWSAAGGDGEKERAIPDSTPARTARLNKEGPFVHLVAGALECIAAVYPAAKFVDVVEVINGVRAEDRSDEREA